MGHFNFNLSEEEAYIQNLKEKSQYYTTVDGSSYIVDDKVYEILAEELYKYPKNIRDKESLMALAKYVNREDKEEIVTYEYISDDGLITEYNKNHPEHKVYSLPEFKNFALSQILYNSECFSSDESLNKFFATLVELPDDRKSVYKLLSDNTLLNLNYVPNKIRMIDEFIPDKLDISFEEKIYFLVNKNIKYEDLSGFDDNQCNFSKKYYTSCVDKIVELLDNHFNAQQIFRKRYQYANLKSAILYNDYKEYNYQSYYLDYDDYIYNDIMPKEQRNYMISEGLTVTSEIPAYKIPEQGKDIMDVYEQNQQFIVGAAINLSSIFGHAAENFIDRYIEANGGSYLSSQPENKMDEFEEDLRYLSDVKFRIRKRISQNQLYPYSNVKVQKIVPICKYPEDVQKKVLTLLSILPDDLNEYKRKSLANFLQNKFLYKNKYGMLESRPLNELQKIFSIWYKLSEKQENMDYKSILKFADSKDYLNAQKIDFTEEAKMHNLSPRLFDIAQAAYLRGIDTPRIIKEDYQIREGDYTIRLMDVKDPKILFIGEGFSCQTIDKIGVYPALSSVQDPYSRAMVVEKKGKPVGLAWLWVGQEEQDGKTYNSLCIDNMELAEGVIPECDEVMDLTKRIAKKIADETNLYRVTIGSHAKHYDPNSYFTPTDKPLMFPDDYINQTPDNDLRGKIDYGDSEDQLIVYENSLVKPISEYDDKQYFVAHRDLYTLTSDEKEQALMVGESAYPDGTSFQEIKEDKKSQFMMLKNMQNKVIGYALYSDAKHYIYDVAMVGNEYEQCGDKIEKISNDGDKYRRFSKIMLRELLQHMQNIGGEWHAHTRENTSYRLVKYMVHAGLVTVNEKEKGVKFGDEVLHDVTFSFLKKNTSEDDNKGLPMQTLKNLSMER